MVDRLPQSRRFKDVALLLPRLNGPELPGSDLACSEKSVESGSERCKLEGLKVIETLFGLPSLSLTQVS